jgi:membrane associated rhomboid family serine protease
MDNGKPCLERAFWRGYWPLVTAAVLLVTGSTSGLQIGYPQVLSALCRDRDGLRAGQWWRILTPLLVHDEGWRQVVLNFLAIAVLGVIVERLYGHFPWLVFYLGAGLVGEIAGYAWQPHGAGASVGGAGLLGALLVWLLVRPGLPWPARVGGIFGLLAAALLSLLHDIHGPPILVGGLLSLGFVIRDRKC